jgi:peptide chain release factor subunit 1
MGQEPALAPRAPTRATPEDRLRIQNTLKRLAARGPSLWPVLSVYVNTRPVGTAMTTYRPFLKKRLNEEMKAFKARSPEHESLSVDAARVQHYLDYDLKEFTRATAVFACYGDGDLFDAVQIPIDFPEALVTVGPLPTLYPLLRVADCYRRAAVVVSDTHSARLFTIALGTIEIRREVRNPLVPKSKSAGELDPSNHQRHADDHRKKHLRQVVRALEELANESQATWILLGGDGTIGAELEGELSPTAREHLLGHFHWDIRIPEAELAAAVDGAVEAREQELRRARAEELVHGGKDTILGVEPTIEALRAARVGRLVLSECLPATAEGWACRACRTFGSGPPPEACAACGRAEVQRVSLREELGAQALAQGADVHFVEARAVPAFDAQGGVGAFARYP